MLKLTYKKANPEDSKFLSEVAQKAKQNWGYPDDWMQLWQEDLTLTPNYIEENLVFKIYDQDRFIGFYAIVDAEIPELDHLWLVPESQRKGYGSQIFDQVRKSISELGKICFSIGGRAQCQRVL